ncbi:MAG: adenylate kinase, partial [Pseudomonadota bacterium]
VDRIAGRYTCGNCGEGYHDSFKRPTVEGVCDTCGGTDMKRRADDTVEAVATRLAAYHAQTAPLIDYYAGQHVLQRVGAMGAIDEIATTLGNVVKAAR